ncbi:MAG: Ditrans,polycis-undecaprenyl-diphosphate synthase ((2E,6E)-farnesyl-diphosphate specific) [Alphaproteobacteria bacterium MarineAlpha3_Bin5]|nr:di-trans,poly-cis-decaprenylcistransferase [Magnetovibrio sp.]PPR78300.1 MAG: Ditrans,polycis-undecaprenyl-diphosphate synthase ((2E,6E)-farnesyl-diphosphate specific) [Alphaproteobacteria bacterium MarineAlpha3_Bin5]
MEALSLQTNMIDSPPMHVAIIMDGNGRWAKARGMSRISGHREGAKAVRRAIESALKEKIHYLTLFGFSSENWNRPSSEIKDLMALLREYLSTEIEELNSYGVKLRFIGELKRLDSETKKLIQLSEELTNNNQKLNLIIALSYGGRAEIVESARALGKQIESGSLRAETIDEKLFENSLYTQGIPDPDLLIRTSGERRISNFLLWQCAYTEFVFFETLWPDFSNVEFSEAIKEYHGRERRYGSTTN